MNKLSRKIALLRRYYFLSADERRIRNHYLGQKTGGNAQADAPIVTVESPSDLLYFGVFGEIVTALRNRLPVRTEQYAFRSLRPGESNSLKDAIWTRLLENWVSDRRCIKLYAAYCDRVAVKSASLLSPIAELRIWRKAHRVWRDSRGKEEFTALTVRGIRIGDLVIDSYVRYKPYPEFVAADRYVCRILRQALRDIEKAYAYFETRKPKLFLTSYTSYIHHGIPARVAIALGIEVVSFGNYQQMCKTLSPEDQTHLAEHWHYRKRFAALPLQEQQALREQADVKLRGRMRGEIDNAIGYMRSSPYDAKSTNVPYVRGAAIVYLPDFYDSIHVYRWTAFHDFWEWACFTIDTLASAGIPFLIKSHPNATADSIFVESRIRARYPDLKFVPAGITTAQLADAGMAFGVSPRGTVLSELAYLGVPVVAGGDHPHGEFDLEPPPETVEDYRRRLLGVAQLPRDPEAMRRRACEFYAMHNLPADPNEIALRDKWLALRAMTMSEDTLARYTAERAIAALQELGNEPSFQKHIDAWVRHIAPEPVPRQDDHARYETRLSATA